MHGVKSPKELSPDTFSRGLCLLLELREERYTPDGEEMYFVELFTSKGKHPWAVRAEKQLDMCLEIPINQSP